MINKVTGETEIELYNYCNQLRKSVPYYFPVPFKLWRKSMFEDCDYDGNPLFAELYTFLLLNNGIICGFIQFGITNFILGNQGDKDFSKKYGIIRNLHFKKDEANTHLLLKEADDYFNKLGIEKRYAFFQYFGMTCYARQGKLHSSENYIEEMLKQHDFIIEHQNVYYSKCIINDDFCNEPDVSFVYQNDNSNISFYMKNELVGGCELYFLQHSNICYLRWIYIDSKYSHQGIGTKCMNKLFYELKQKGILRIDTDTAHNNVNAQKYYIKTGYSDMGRMASYYTK